MRTLNVVYVTGVSTPIQVDAAYKLKVPRRGRWLNFTTAAGSRASLRLDDVALLSVVETLPEEDTAGA